VASSCAAGGNETFCATGSPSGIAESVCNGVDDDCDSATDEDYESVPTSCGVGACAATGTSSCVAGAELPNCTPGTQTDEVCNGIDDDCDGAIDNGLTFVTYYRDADNDTYGNADNATITCYGAPEGYVDNLTDDNITVAFDCDDNDSAVNPGASDANCNGIDDNCDNATDEGYVPVTSCFLPGACAAGNVASSCAAGGIETACATGTPAASDATCNGIDDDCDGATDQGYVPVTSCFLPGACAAGNVASSCAAGGIETACVTGTPAASDATCNGIDDDCDGATDEDYTGVPTSCGVGACASTGVTSCVAGEIRQNCAAGTPTEEVCNGIDDDCDDVIDNGLVFQTYYQDADNDTYGNADISTVACAAPEGYVDNLTADNTTAAFDCNDNDSSIHTGCDPDTCILKVVPRKIFKLFVFLNPFVPYVVSADRDSGVEFVQPIDIDWGTDYIKDIFRIKIGKRIIVGFLFVRPLLPGEFDVVVTYGDNNTKECGTIEVL
jgi:hypothetical protein